MQKYLVLYRSTVSATDQMAAATPEQGKAEMDAWMHFRAPGASIEAFAFLPMPGT